MAEESNLCHWDELLPDALGLIFKRLPLCEVLSVVPRVCKSWENVVKGPYCWQEIDIENWSQNHNADKIDRMLQMLITRSCGSVRKICVSGLPSDSSFSFIAINAKSLQTLQLPRSEITNSIMEQVGKFSKLTFLDVSYCIKMGAPALEAIGKHCKFLTSLRRIMHPLEVIDKLSQDDEALAIANTMPKLEHLEIPYLVVSTTSIIEIITNCRHLELLDVRGCWDVNLDDKFVKKFPRLKLVGPVVVDYHEGNDWDWDNSSEYSGSSGYMTWDFVAGGMDDDYDEFSDGFWEEEQHIEDVGMWFYNDLDLMETEYDWPRSP